MIIFILFDFIDNVLFYLSYSLCCFPLSFSLSFFLSFSLSLSGGLCHMSMIKPTNSVLCNSGHLWYSILFFVVMEMCTKLYSKTPQWGYERGQMDGQIVLVSILSHSTWLIFLKLKITHDIYLYHRDAYFGIRKYFLYIMKIEIKMYKNKFVKRKKKKKNLKKTF